MSILNLEINPSTHELLRIAVKPKGVALQVTGN